MTENFNSQHNFDPQTGLPLNQGSGQAQQVPPTQQMPPVSTTQQPAPQQQQQPQTPHVQQTQQPAQASSTSAGSSSAQQQATHTQQMPPVTPVYETPAAKTYSSTPNGANNNSNEKSESSKKSAKTFGIAFAGAALACIIGIGGFALVNSNGKTTSGTSVTLGATTNTEITAQDSDSSLAETVASKALPSVAAIDVYTKQSSSSSSSIFGYGMGNNSNSDSSTLTQSSLGSGVVLSADGYIVTNYHVIEGADALKVTVGGEQYDADTVGSDESSDIAVIKLRDASGLTPIEIGDSDNLTIGEWVMSIGSPFGLEQSVATGIVSATSRSQIIDSSSSSSGSGSGSGSGNGYGYGYGYGNGSGSSSSSSSSGYTIYPNMIQTDAAINPGNSGGALVDKNGKLIGINTLITSYSGNYSGVGFAIPVNYAVNLAQQIIEGKTPTHAQLGVSMTTVNSTNAKRYGLKVSAGAYVSSVSSSSGAASAGIQEGDIITKFDGQTVESASDLMLDVRSKNPGDKVSVEVNRDGETKQFEVTLGSDETSSSSSSSSSSGSTRKNSSDSSSEELLNRLYGNSSSSENAEAA